MGSWALLPPQILIVKNATIRSTLNQLDSRPSGFQTSNMQRVGCPNRGPGGHLAPPGQMICQRARLALRLSQSQAKASDLEFGSGGSNSRRTRPRGHPQEHFVPSPGPLQVFDRDHDPDYTHRAVRVRGDLEVLSDSPVPRRVIGQEEG